jgi:transcriptional regulator with GAF, ATPase, and Fis domain
LRVLQTGEIQRVGGSKSIPLDIRVIAATHRHLGEMVQCNEFREDLWYRLNVCPMVIPPLRERKADIPELVSHFIVHKAKQLRLDCTPVLGHGAIERLMDYQWPGNVRELENIVERALILTRTGPITFDRFVPPQREYEMTALPARHRGPLNLDEVVADHIRSVLAMTKGRVYGPGGAAELLGVNPSTLRNKMKKLSISFGRSYGDS